MPTRPHPHAPQPPSDFSSGRAILLLWLGILAGPALVLLNLEIAYALVPWSCNRGTEVALHLVMLCSLALVGLAGWRAWHDWRSAGATWPDDRHGPAERARFMGMIGIMSSALAATVLVAQWLPILFLSPCSIS